MQPINPETPVDADELLQKKLAEADQRSAELMREMTIGEIIDGGMTPEMLENLDPVQLQNMLREMDKASGRKRHPQSFYTRKQPTKAARRSKAKAQRKARQITSRTGGGRTISRRRKLKKAA